MMANTGNVLLQSLAGAINIIADTDVLLRSDGVTTIESTGTELKLVANSGFS